MPAKSKKQFKLMAAIAHGAHIPGVNIGKGKAKEFVTGVDYKSLPMKKSMHGSGQFNQEEMTCGYRRLA